MAVRDTHVPQGGRVSENSHGNGPRWRGRRAAGHAANALRGRVASPTRANATAFASAAHAADGTLSVTAAGLPPQLSGVGAGLAPLPSPTPFSQP